MNDEANTKANTRPRTMSSRQIVKAIRRKEGSLRAFADRIEKGVSTVSMVCKGVTVSAPIAKAIADVVGRAPHEIWPRIYAEDGGPLSSHYRRTA